MSLGGYSPSSLKDQKLVREVLAKEFKVAGKSPEERQQNIEEVFRTIGAYEGLYETAMVLAYSGDLDQAARLISWADELIAGKDNVPIPELKIMHAIVRMMLAERDMPWTGETGLLPATKSKAGQLACIPVFPAHTTQWDSIRERGEEVRLQGVRAIEKTSKEKAMENLGIARLLLEKAENIVGADKLTIMGTRACVYFYMGEYETAGRTSDRAIKLAGKATDTARDALKSNAALIKFAVFASMDSEPGSGQKKTRDVWVSKLKARQKDFTANRDLKKLVSALIRGSDLAELKFSDDAQQTDTSKNTLKLPKYRASGIRMGECPEGWVFDNSVPTRDEKDTESKYGVTACRSKINNGERLVHVVLPQVSSPDYEETDMTVFISENPADQMGDIAIWRGNCGGKIKKTAVSDDGATVFRVACPKVNAPLGMIQVEDDKVTKVGMVE